MNKTSFLIPLTCLLLSLSTVAQVPLDTWRTHYSYYQGEDLIEVNDKIYCITEGGLCYADKSDNTVRPVTKKDGLGGLNITTMAFHDELNVLILGYADGTIDIIKNGNIRTLLDIQRKVTLINKRINNITLQDNKAYFACGFGIAVMNLENILFEDTYLIGENNTERDVNEIVFSQEQIYAATANGIYLADPTNSLLADARSWVQLGSIPNAGGNYTDLVVWNDNVLAAYPATIGDSITSYEVIQIVNDTNYTHWDVHNTGTYLSMNVTNDRLVMANKSSVSVYNTSNKQEMHLDVVSPKKGLIDSDGQLWVADDYNGLKMIRPDNSVEYFLINGPLSKYVSEIRYFNDAIYVASTNEAITSWQQGIYRFKDEKWDNYYNFNHISRYDKFFPSIHTFAFNPQNRDKYFAGSIRYGLVEFDGQEPVATYDASNSALQIVDNTSMNYPYDIRITGMDFDANGNLWFAQDHTRHPVTLKTNDGEWISIELKYSQFGRNVARVTDLVVDQYGQKWLLIESVGVLVFKETDDSYENFVEKLMTFTHQDGETRDFGYCLEEDTEGNIWVGTNEGPLVYHNSPFLIDNDITTGEQIKIPRNDGTGIADFLLSTVTVNDLSFDGGNRMWVATGSGGAFLISSDGQEEIHHFTTDNSPLISNNILTLDVHDKTGEVFFGTDQGILSYRSGSTKGDDQFGDVYVFPNPVKPGFDGDIVVTDLALNANVKITDVSGNLVYETTAIGSQAIWDGRDLWGNKVNTGVYLVFCVNEDGSETHVTKLLFVK